MAKKHISEMTEMPFSELNMQHMASHDARVTAYCSSLTYYFKLYTSLQCSLKLIWTLKLLKKEFHSIRSLSVSAVNVLFAQCHLTIWCFG